MVPELLRPPSISPILVPGWEDLSWLVHGFSTRPGGASTAYGRGGDLNIGFTAADAPDNVRVNRERLIEHLAGDPHLPLVTLRQTHSALMHRVDDRDARPAGSPAVLEGDGLLTDRPGLLLGIQTADCIPVLLVDTRRRAVGAFHAGWRGTLARIVELGVSRMRSEFGSQPGDLRAAIGPAIGACCYTVGEEVRRQFSDAFAYADRLFAGSEQTSLDLEEANRQQLLSAGLSESSVICSHACTRCDTQRFFSHRAEKGITGRMTAVIGIRA